ncbi:hypothetical protein ACU686_13585 [Yinghuangia aomiensis]
MHSSVSSGRVSAPGTAEVEEDRAFFAHEGEHTGELLVLAPRVGFLGAPEVVALVVVGVGGDSGRRRGAHLGVGAERGARLPLHQLTHHADLFPTLRLRRGDDGATRPGEQDGGFVGQDRPHQAQDRQLDAVVPGLLDVRDEGGESAHNVLEPRFARISLERFEQVGDRGQPGPVFVAHADPPPGRSPLRPGPPG